MLFKLNMGLPLYLLDTYKKCNSIFDIVFNKNTTFSNSSLDEWLKMLNFFSFNISFKRGLSINDITNNFKLFLLTNVIYRKSNDITEFEHNQIFSVVKQFLFEVQNLSAKERADEVFKEIVTTLQILILVVDKTTFFKVQEITEIKILLTVIKGILCVYKFNSEKHSNIELFMIHLIEHTIQLSIAAPAPKEEVKLQTSKFSYQIKVNKKTPTSMIKAVESFSYYKIKKNPTIIKRIEEFSILPNPKPKKNEEENNISILYNANSFAQYNYIVDYLNSQTEGNKSLSTHFLSQLPPMLWYIPFEFKYERNLIYDLFTIGSTELGLVDNIKNIDLVMIFRDKDYKDLDINTLRRYLREDLLNDRDNKNSFWFNCLSEGKIIVNDLYKRFTVYIWNTKYFRSNKILDKIFHIPIIKKLHIFLYPIFEALGFLKRSELSFLLVAFLDCYYRIFNRKEKVFERYRVPKLSEDCSHFIMKYELQYYYKFDYDSLNEIERKSSFSSLVKRCLQFYSFLVKQVNYKKCNELPFEFFDYRYLLNLREIVNLIITQNKRFIHDTWRVKDDIIKINDIIDFLEDQIPAEKMRKKLLILKEE